MADEEDGGFLNFSLPKKIQLGAIGIGILLFLLTYIVQGLLNGYAYVNTWITSNPVPVAAYLFFLIGFFPFYSDIDPRRVKYVKQAIYDLISHGLPFLGIWIYYQYNPPTTGVGRVVAGLSWLIIAGTVFNFMLSNGLQKLGKDSEE